MKIRLKHAIIACLICFMFGSSLMFIICEKEIWFWNIRKNQDRLDIEIKKIRSAQPLIEEEVKNLKMMFEIWRYEVEKTLNWDRFTEAQAEENQEK